MKKQKEKANVFRNIAYMLGCAFRCSPFSLMLIYFSYILTNVYQSVVIGVMFLKTTLSVIEGNFGFRTFAISVTVVVIGQIAVDMLDYFVSFYVRIRFEIRCESHINAMLFEKARQVELACYETPEFFDKFTRASWIIEKYGFQKIIEGLAWTLGSVVSLVLMVIYLVSIDPIMILFIFCPVISVVFKTLRNKNDFKMEKEMTEPERRKDYVLRTVLLKDFSKEIKTTNIFAVLKRNFKAAVSENVRIIKKYGLINTFIETGCDFFGSVLPVGCGFLYSGFKLISGALPIADFSVLVSAIIQCRSKLNNFGYYFAQMQKQCLYVQSFRDFMAYEPKITDGPLNVPEFECLEFRNVYFKYEGSDSYTLENVSFRLNKGETLSVVGHNGAGKTTLTKLIMRLYDVTEGEILYNGVNIKEYKLKEYREKFGSVFQDYMVFAMTVGENILTRETTEEDRAKITECLKTAGVYDKTESLGEGIDTVLTREFDDEGALLSGGERQKLAVARLFAKDCEIAVLDEPSSALDPVAETAMYENLRTATRGKAVVYISHRLSSAVSADRILLFANGKLKEEGSHEELVALGGEYAKMFELQASGYSEEVTSDEK